MKYSDFPWSLQPCYWLSSVPPFKSCKHPYRGGEAERQVFTFPITWHSHASDPVPEAELLLLFSGFWTLFSSFSLCSCWSLFSLLSPFLILTLSFLFFYSLTFFLSAQPVPSLWLSFSPFLCTLFSLFCSSACCAWKNTSHSFFF